MRPTLARASLALLVGIGIVAGMGGAAADPVQESTEVETTDSGDVSTMCGTPGDGDGGDGGSGGSGGGSGGSGGGGSGGSGGGSGGGGGGSGPVAPKGPVFCK